MRAHRVLDRAHLRLEVGVAVGETEAALAHDVEVAALDLEHVEVVEERPAGVEAAARVRDRADAVAAPEQLARHHLALEEAQHERVVLRERRDERRADAGLRRGDRVVDLVLAVDREQPRVLARDADDEGAGRGRDLVVRVRQPAGEPLDLALAAELRNRLQDVFERHRAILYLD